MKGTYIWRATGLSSIDLLVTLTVSGLCLLMAASALTLLRETSRQRQCQDNLRQLGEAMLAHHEKIGHLPTGGWGYAWVGDADRGFGQRQPGGWIYNVLPYIGEEALHDLGSGRSEEEKRVAHAKRAQISLRLFNCPSRRQFQLYPCVGRFSLANQDPVEKAARADYAACAGQPLPLSPGPQSYAQADALGVYRWPPSDHFTGIGGVRSMIRLRDITDGQANTYMIGEKYLNEDMYKVGRDMGDDGDMYMGFDWDIYRVAPLGWRAGPVILTDRPGYAQAFLFGSPHPYGCHFVFCDGSVRNVSTGIDPDVHARLANRQDGQPTDMDEYSHLVDFQDR